MPECASPLIFQYFSRTSHLKTAEFGMIKYLPLIRALIRHKSPQTGVLLLGPARTETFIRKWKLIHCFIRQKIKFSNANGTPRRRGTTRAKFDWLRSGRRVVWGAPEMLPPPTQSHGAAAAHAIVSGLDNFKSSTYCGRRCNNQLSSHISCLHFLL